MTKPVPVKGRHFAVSFGDGATPEVFTKLCGLKNAELSQTFAAAFEETVFDCDDPDDVGAIYREVGVSDWSISGSGLYNPAQIVAVEGLFGAVHTFRFMQTNALTLPKFYWEGKGFITSNSISATDTEMGQMATEIIAAGPLIRAPIV
jgi:Phage tail tube protein